MEKKTSVRVAAAQIAPDLTSREKTLARVLDAIREAATKGAELIVFPETFVPWYPYFSFVLPPVLSGKEHVRLYEEAVTVPSAATDAVSAAAREHGIVVALGVNERDHGSLYNAQLLFDADGTLLLKRRKITPTFHERMIWGQGDASGLKVVDSAVGRLGALACWEHYNPLARYALMAQHEDIHIAQFPGSMVGPIFADPARRLHDCNHLARRQTRRAAADGRRRHPDRRSRHEPDREAQADDGFGRPLCPARAAASCHGWPRHGADGHHHPAVPPHSRSKDPFRWRIRHICRPRF
jgi:predicted amidohydrolase